MGAIRQRFGHALGVAYPRLYGAVAGVHPDLRPWHFQWLAGRTIYRPLRETLAPLVGDVLDVGCGSKPYRNWFRETTRYVGIDTINGPEVDVVIVPGESWPFEGSSFDFVVCTQVLEHVADLDSTLSEMRRVLRPNGMLVVTVPFIYNEHGGSDYRRFSRYEAAALFGNAHVDVRGGVGTVLGTALLNWLDIVISGSGPLALLRLLLLPAWLGFALITNAGALALDRLDRTDRFYSNVLIVARGHEAKPSTAVP